MENDHVWAFEYCSCTYESDFKLVSLHRRAVSAYLSMKEFRDREIERWTWGCLSDLGYFLYPGGSRHKGAKPDWLVRIRKIEINND